MAGCFFFVCFVLLGGFLVNFCYWGRGEGVNVLSQS